MASAPLACLITATLVWSGSSAFTLAVDTPAQTPKTEAAPGPATPVAPAAPGTPVAPVAPVAPAIPSAEPAAPAPPDENPKVVPEKEGSGELDLTHFPGEVVDDVIVPVPSEIFSVLDKLGDPDWKSQIHSKARPAVTERTDVALMLGAVVADGFIAVQAEDIKSVQQAGRDVLALATSLGVRDDVLRHCQAIEDGARTAKWDTVRTELDATQATVRAKMEGLRDGALAECISVGGWLRGMEVITKVVSSAWTSERSEVLLQPDLAHYFNDSLEEMFPRVAQPAKLKEIADGVARLSEIMQSGADQISLRNVEEMNRLCAEMVTLITTKK